MNRKRVNFAHYYIIAMKSRLLIPILCAGLACFWGCKSNTEHHGHDHGHEHHEHAEHDHDHDHDHDHEHAGHSHEHGHEHEHGAATFGGEIVLEPEAAKAFGVETAVINPAPFHQVVRATGQILNLNSHNGIVAAPKAGTVHLTRSAEAGAKVGAGAVIAVIDSKGISGGSTDAAAKAVMEQAQREYDRIKALYDERLATVAELNAAESALATAKAQYSPKAMAGNATSPIAGIVTAVEVVEGQFVEVGQTIATVASAKELQLRIDVPQKDFASIANLNNAVIRLPYTSTPLDINAAGGHRVATDAVPSQATSGAYVPVYFQLPNDGTLIPGSTFSAYLTGVERSGVITVPVEAVVEQQGDYFVFSKIDEHGYKKHKVTTGASDGKVIEIITGIEPGTEIVTKGATTVRLAEASAVIPEGHTHNH